MEFPTMSAPFNINLNEHESSDPFHRSTTSETPNSTTFHDSIEPYAPLLPACYRTTEDDLAIPTPSFDYLNRELSVSRLNTIHHWLWAVGRPMPPRPLHHQKVLGREIIPTERTDMHLVWSESRIFIKPLPRYLLSPQFWTDHLSCHPECCSHPKTAASSNPCDQHVLRQNALGFLLSYAALISYESDFHIAQETHLLPTHISWAAWKLFTRSLLTQNAHSIYTHINRRYIYGELRLNRLNTIYRCTQFALRGYMPGYTRYGSFLRENFAWIASLFAYVVIVLTAMQVGLGTRFLYESEAFQKVSWGVAVFTIVAAVASVVGVMGVLAVVVGWNWWKSGVYMRGRFGRVGGVSGGEGVMF